MSRIPRNAVLAAAALLVFVAVAVAVDLQIVLQSHSTQTVWALTKPVLAGDQLGSDNGNVRRVQVPQTGDSWAFYTGDLLKSPQRADHKMDAGTMIFQADILREETSLVTLSLKTPPPVGKGDPVDVYATVDNRTMIVGRHLVVDSVSGNNYSVLVPSSDEPAWITLEANNVALFAARSSGVGVPDTAAQNISDAVSTLSGGTVVPGIITASPSPSPAGGRGPTPSPSPKRP
jgi:hypothetical protein